MNGGAYGKQCEYRQAAFCVSAFARQYIHSLKLKLHVYMVDKCCREGTKLNQKYLITVMIYIQLLPARPLSKESDTVLLTPPDHVSVSHTTYGIVQARH